MFTLAKTYLLVTAIVWSGYGVAVAFFPDIIVVLTGIGIEHWTADLEVRAWYLCTEIGLGILAFYGYKEPENYMKINFLIWMVIFTVLVAFRFAGTWYFESYWDLRPGLEHLPDSYHIATAYVYELPSMLLFIWFWIKRDELVPKKISG